MSLTIRVPFLLLSIFCLQITSSYAGQMVRVSPDLEIYYEEAGKGEPLILVPGWTGTTALFQKQFAHFSKKYRTIVYDPRSQGRSTKTIKNNTYTQHGTDLKGLMDALKVDKPVLIAWSWGCYDVYAYIRLFGTNNIKAYVCIDQTHKDLYEKEGDWYSYKAAAEMKGFHDGMVYDRVKTTKEFMQAMVTRPVTEDEKTWFTNELLKTPTYVAVSLMMDGYLADYTAEAKAIDGKIPVLNMLADPGWFEGWTSAAKNWLKANAPNSKIFVLGLHMMPWEFPEKFNAAVNVFLAEAK